MRLWSIHPQYLDAKGLVALWREALLAKHVLEGKTRGYTQHPQLIRFRETADPLGSILYYLGEVFSEAEKRDYHFSKEKFDGPLTEKRIFVSKGQLDYEFQHLLKKLKIRDAHQYDLLSQTYKIQPHPLFVLRQGGVEEWEKLK